jgi:thioredoxin 1
MLATLIKRTIRQRYKQSIVSLVWFLAIISTSNSFSQADHIGVISPSDLLADYPEFKHEYDAYEPSQLQLDQIQQLAGKSVTALFGTWCHDSEREVPRLLKLLKVADVKVSELTLFAVDRKKQDQEGFAAKYDLRYTPTIIVSDGDNNELGRVIEKPKVDLASDLATQLTH